MAITIGTPTAVYSEDSSITIAKPTGAVDGTLLIAAIFTDNGYFDELADPPPAGWTLVESASHDTGFSSGGQLKIFTRIVSGDGAAYTFDHRDGTSTTCSIVPVFGAGPTPTLSWTKDATTTTETAPAGVSTSATDALLCWMCVAHESGAMGVYTPPAGMTEIVENSGLWASHSVAKLEAIGSVGSTGTKDFGLSGASKRTGTPEVGVTLVIVDPGGGEEPVEYDGTATLTATDSLTSAGRVGMVTAAALAATATLAAAGMVATGSGATVDQTAAIAAAGAVGSDQGATLAATGTIAASGAVGHRQGATLAGTAEVTTGGGVGTASGTALTGTADIDADGTVGTPGGATLAATADIDATGRIGTATGTTLAAAVEITADGAVVSVGSGAANLATTGTITAAGTVARGGQATLAATTGITAIGTVGRSSGATLAASVTITAGTGALHRVLTARMDPPAHTATAGPPAHTARPDRPART